MTRDVGEATQRPTYLCLCVVGSGFKVRLTVACCLVGVGDRTRSACKHQAEPFPVGGFDLLRVPAGRLVCGALVGLEVNTTKNVLWKSLLYKSVRARVRTPCKHAAWDSGRRRTRKAPALIVTRFWAWVEHRLDSWCWLSTICV